MTTEINSSNLMQDTLQETVTQYAAKLLDKGAAALRAAATDARSLAQSAADRATHFKSMLANLDTLSTSVYQQLSSVETSKLSTQTRAFAEMYRSEIGKAEGFFKAAMQNQNASAVVSSIGKHLGSLIGAIELISTVSDPKASNFSVGKDLAALGGGILAGAAIGLAGTAATTLVAPVGAAVVGIVAGRTAWNTYASAIGWDEKTSPNFHETMRGTLNTMKAGHFLFQDSFIAPASYVDGSAASADAPSATGTIVLNGGGGGVRFTTDSEGRMVVSLTGLIYSHDTATSNTFVIAKQEGVSNYWNTLRGFKHGVDRIDLSQTGIRSFSELTIEKRNRATVNGLAQIHGVSLSSKSLGRAGAPVEIAYLDALDPGQLSESDFIFAGSQPASTGGPPAAPQLSAPVIEPAETTPPMTAAADSFPDQPPALPLVGDASMVWMVDSAIPWASGSLSSRLMVPAGEGTTYTASLADGSPLPPWLTFDATQNQLVSTPGEAQAGTLRVKVKATAASGEQDETTLALLIHWPVLRVGDGETVSVADSQVAIDQAGSASAVTASGGQHLLLLSGESASAHLSGAGANEIAVTAAGAKLTLGDGDTTIVLRGFDATVASGDGNNRVSSVDPMADIALGDGNNTVSGHFESLSVGTGRNVIESTGLPGTLLRLGDGEDVATLKSPSTTVHVGHGKYELEYEGLHGKLIFSPDIAAERLWFQHTGSDLRVSVTGGSETVTLKDWYAPTEDRPSTIVAGDGKQLASGQVENLVQAMAAFSQPAAGTIALTQEQHASLQPVLAANWH